MAQFEVDFSESLNGLTRLQAGVSALGTSLDGVQKKGGAAVQAAKQLTTQMDAVYTKIAEDMKKAGMNAASVQTALEGARIAATAAMTGIATANLKATVSAQSFNKEMTDMRRLLEDTAKKNAYTQSMLRIAQVNSNLVNSNRELMTQIAALDSGNSKLNSALKIQLKNKQDILGMDQKSAAENKLLLATIESMNSERSKENQTLRQTIANRQAEYRENTKLEGTLQVLERQYRSLNGGLQQQIAEMQALIAARKRSVTEATREEAEIQRLTRALASLTGGRQEEIAKLNAQIRARQRAIAEAMQEKKVVDELAAAIKREQDQLTRLRAQSMLMSGSHGQQVLALRSQIAEQTNLNNLRAMSMRQLLGLQGAQERHNLSMQAGSQMAASLRAGITGLHASFGMYTSATVLAASATYAFTSSVRDSIITGAEFFDTMQRTKAIMSTGGPQWLTTGGDYAKAMEEQVRALGMTTVYTATEVGQGLQELGKAGFSASQSIEALPASLQLANLANVSMARSADIATNVLMTFNKEAKDLGSVVDLMATAVNNSNTDIEQLANALTYIGPAAQTAGISLEETVAAVEALANSGFKSSRAGTGLRRLFVSLLNPTKKGSEVLEKFNISVVDAEGQTRSLVDIVGQLNKAMGGLSNPDKLGAVQDLVGTYASSQVAALIAQYDNFKKFAEENQPDNVKGAGDRMEEIINQSLKKDWKTFLSSIEEVQLTAFSQMDMRLRQQVASMSTWVLDLLKPSQQGFGVFQALADSMKETVGLAREGEGAASRQAEAVQRLASAQERYASAQAAVKTAGTNLGNGTGTAEQLGSAKDELKDAKDLLEKAEITRLDRMLMQVENSAKVVAGLVGGVLAYKFASGSIFRSMAADLGGPTGAASRMRQFTTRMAENSMTALANANAQRAATGSVTLLGRASVVTSVTLMRLGEAATWAAAAGARLMAVMAGVSRVLGWVGLIVGIGYAISSIWSDDTETDILAQRDAVDEVKSSYEGLAEAIKNSGLERQKAALALAQKADQKSVDQFGTRISATEGLLKTAEEVGAPEAVIKAYKDELVLLKNQQKEYSDRVTEASKKLETFGKNELDVMNVQEQRVAVLAELVDLQRQLNSAQLQGSADFGYGGIISALQERQQAALLKLQNKTNLVQVTKDQVPPISDYFKDEESRRLEEVNEAAYKKTTSNAQQLLDVTNKLTEASQARKNLEKLDQEAIQAGGRRVGRDEADRVNKTLSDLETKKLELQEKVDAEKVQLGLAEREVASKNRSDAENMLAYKQRDLEITKELNAARNPGEGKAADPAKITQLLREQAQVKNDIISLDKKGERSSNSAEKASERAAKKAAAQLEKDFSAYESLAKKYDAESYAKIQLNEGIESMNRLRQQNIDTMGKEGITSQQQARATAELRKQYYLSTLEMDKHYGALQRLRESYGSSPYDQSIADLAEMNYQLKANTMSLEEYSRMANTVREQRQSSLVSSLPTVDMGANTGSDSTVFNGFARSVMTYSSDMKQFKDAGNTLDQGYVGATSNLDQQLKLQVDQQNAKQEAAAEHAKHMEEILRADYDKRNALDMAYGEDNQKVQLQMYQYQKANGKMMEIAAVGMMSNIFGMFAAVGADATGAQKAAFVASKALAVAQIIMYTELAAIKAMSAPDVPFFGMQLPAANLIRGFGYASAGLVTGLSIASLAGGSDMTGQASGGGANMYDTGGTIPYNRVGIVGEYGPELVSGPATVKGRTATASALAGGGGGMEVTIAPVVQVTIEGSGGKPEDDIASGKRIAATVNALVEKRVEMMTREGGMLDQWRRNNG